VEFERLDNGLEQHQFTVYCHNSEKTLIVAGGFLLCSPGSGPLLKRTGVIDFLKAHVTSLVLDAKRIDLEALKGPYAKLARTFDRAQEKTFAGDTLRRQKKYAEARKAYLEALVLCEDLPAAHRSLAFLALAPSADPDAQELADAYKHAKKAVELTERRDALCAVILAAICHKRGDTREAVQVIREALEIRPKNESLLKTLKVYESTK